MVARKKRVSASDQSPMLNRLLWLTIWFFGAGTWLGFTLRWWAGDHFLVARLINYFMPWFLLFLVPLLLFSLHFQRRWLALFLVPPILAIIIIYAPLFSPVLRGRAAAVAKTESAVLKVMTYNVWSQNMRIDAMARTIQEQSPDILLLQEIDKEKLADLMASLEGFYPESLHVSHEPRLMQAVISRYPIEPLEAIRHKGQAQIVRLHLPTGPLTVFNVHPLRRGGWQQRHRQIAALLAEEIAAIHGPVILGGDFNTTDQTQLYRRVTRYLHDAHWAAGYGFGFTYPTSNARLLGPLPLPPLVRIDHIFFSPHFCPSSARTLTEAGGSDHFPVVAEFIFPAKCE